MNYLIGIALGLWIGASVYLAVRLYVSARRDGVWEDERPEWADDFEARLAQLYDQIAAFEADRIDAEWEAMNR